MVICATVVAANIVSVSAGGLTLTLEITASDVAGLKSVLFSVLLPVNVESSVYVALHMPQSIVSVLPEHHHWLRQFQYQKFHSWIFR